MKNSLRLAVASSLAAIAAVPFASAVTLTYDADTTAPANDGPGVWDTTTPNWSNGTNDVVWANTTADTAIFGAAAAGTGGAVVVGTVNVGTIQFTPQTTTGYTLNTGTITLGGTAAINTTSTVNSTISAKISGTSGLNFSNSNVNAQNGLTLSGVNDYTGVTTLVDNGRLTVSNAASLGSSAGASATALGGNHTVVSTGASVGLGVASTSEAFLINGFGATGTNPQGAIRFAATTTLASFVQLGSASQVTSNGSGTVTLNGNLDLAGFNLGVGNGALAFAITKPLVVNGILSGTSAAILDVGAGGGSNVANLNNTANTFAGTVRVNASSGTSFIGLGANGVLGTSSLTFNGGGVQSTDGTARTIANTINTFTGNANFGQTTIQTGTLSFTSATASSLGTAVRTLTTNVNTAFANPFTGTGGITKAGAAAMSLTGDSSYSGATTVSAGTLLINNLTGSGTGAGLVSVTGTLGGTGTIGGIANATGAVTINNLATLAPGDPATNGGIGTLTIGSAAVPRATVMADGSTFSIQTAAGAGNNDRLNTFGLLDLTGNQTLTLSGTLDGTTNYVIATFGTLTGTFENVQNLGSYMVQYNANNITLAVPEPTTYAMLVAGSGLMFTVLRRRRRS